jgi:hypothetical protein
VAGFLVRLLIACLTRRRIEFTKGRKSGGGDCGTAEAVPLSEAGFELKLE